MFKVHNWWGLVGAVALLIFIYDLWKNGSTTVQLANTTGNFALSLVNALKA